MANLTDILTTLKQGVIAINTLQKTLAEGSNSFTALVQLPTYTVATVPSAASWTGALIYVSNASAGAQPAFSDGTNWRITSTRAILT